MWIEYAEGIGFVNVFHASTSEYAHRDNGRLQNDDVSLAESIFQRISPILPASLDGLSPCGCSSNIRIYRYCQGQRFGRHIDESHTSPEGVSKFTMLIYLNGEEDESGKAVTESQMMVKKRKKSDKSARDTSCVEEEEEEVEVSVCEDKHEGLQLLAGGETQFYLNMYGRSPQVSVRPVAGRVLLHGHGHRCLTHEGAEVLSGVKYVLRTDVLYN